MAAAEFLASAGVLNFKREEFQICMVLLTTRLARLCPFYKVQAAVLDLNFYSRENNRNFYPLLILLQ